MNYRFTWLGLIILALLVGLFGCVVDRGSTSPSSVTTPSPDFKPRKGTALAALAELQTAPKAPEGYVRARFGRPWDDLDNNGCDQRSDVLRRDLKREHIKPGTHGCIPASGWMRSPYTGIRVDFERGDGDIEIDHVVSLSNAWASGARSWNPDRRTELANDFLNLLAVDSESNRSKSDYDASRWAPDNRPFRCKFFARQVAVKKKYELTVTASERSAIEGWLRAECPGIRLPSASSVKVPAPVG